MAHLIEVSLYRESDGKDYVHNMRCSSCSNMQSLLICMYTLYVHPYTIQSIINSKIYVKDLYAKVQIKCHEIVTLFRLHHSFILIYRNYNIHFNGNYE